MMPRQKDTQRVDPMEVKQYLLAKGVSEKHAAGILANIEHESNFNPAAIGDQGTSGGLFQHHNERFSALKQYAKEDWKDWRKQVDFALGEGDSKKYLSSEFNTPEEASEWWTKKWERPADADQKAKQRAKTVGNYYQIQQEDTPELLPVTPLSQVVSSYQMADGQMVDVTLEDLEKEVEVVQKAEEKTQASPARQSLENKQMFFDEVTQGELQDDGSYAPIANYTPQAMQELQTIFETNLLENQEN